MFVKKESYNLDELLEEVRHIIEGDLIADLANVSSLLYSALADVNWLGFYILKGKDLIVGPFQGQPACVRIPLGKGVCGTAALEKKTQLVDNVADFPGHIACDAVTKSEIVVPIIRDGQVLAVLDVDSPKLKRFSKTDKDFFEKVVSQILVKLNW
ncbi:MAG: GAF domain-containing protein [Bdellovibrionales bacterium]|nr:GAF domain-containing protein [Bdellovibrionales bacterium]